MLGIPAPTPILKSRGTFREDRHGKRVESFPAGKPTCPKHVKGEAKAEWNRQVKALAQAGVLSLVDRALLADWCILWSLSIQAAKEQDRVEYRKLVELQVKVGTQLGFSPVARARVTALPEAGEVDKLDEFLGETG